MISNIYFTILIPALNEAQHIGHVVREVRRQAPGVRVIVIDDGSTDDTATNAIAAGAEVIISSLLGKGASMRDGLESVHTPWVLYLDGDMSYIHPELVERMVSPLAKGTAELVKARFSRSGGRVTELTAKPLLRIFFPELLRFAQPLGGIVAGTTKLLHSITFDDDYGVDVGLLIDAHVFGACIAEVDIGDVVHDSQPLEQLSLMAQQVSNAILRRAKASNRFSFEHYLEVAEIERRARGTFERIANRLTSTYRVALLDMDGTLVEGRFVQALARRCGREPELNRWLDNNDLDASTRSDAIASVFKFVHQRDFVHVARGLSLRDGAISLVRRLRRAGWLVGVVSDSYYIAADIVRRRVFADFALAHFMTFTNEISSGQLCINPAFYHGDSVPPNLVSKANVIRHLRKQAKNPLLVAAVGDNVNDLPMLAAADLAFTIDPKNDALRVANVQEVRTFAELGDLLLGEKDE